MRRAAALASRQAAEATGQDASPSESEAAQAPPRRNETKLQEKKRKREEEKAIAKIKALKQFQRSRRGHEPADLTDDGEAASAISKDVPAALPGQMENCELCETRFTVTAYSRTGPNGGLLCPKCSKELDKEEGSKKKKQAVSRGNRRGQQSKLLDGICQNGAKDLITLCIETLAKNVHLADDFGDLPTELIQRLGYIISKKRLMNSSTLNLFLKPSHNAISVTDASKINSDDFTRIFQTVPKVKHLRLRNAIQFKNMVMDYLTGSPVQLETFSIHGANLIDDEHWNSYLIEKGRYLRALKVSFTDGHFGDEQLELLKVACPDLARLKVSHNQKATDKGLRHIALLPNLRHLSLELYNTTSSEPYIEILDSIGNGLHTFSLEAIHYLDNSVLEAIHKNCASLSKLRLTDNTEFTDASFVDLFSNWSNPPLTFVDLHKCRHLESTNPRNNLDGVGLCSAGFEALMAHSGKTIKHLNIHSCRHISTEAFERVFAENKTYPELAWMDVSFCWGVNDFVVGSMFRSCPNLKNLSVFGNFGVESVKVPNGRILIGVPNAIGMQIEGEEY
jgi:DNA repair protein RAD7